MNTITKLKVLLLTIVLVKLHLTEYFAVGMILGLSLTLGVELARRIFDKNK